MHASKQPTTLRENVLKFSLINYFFIEKFYEKKNPHDKIFINSNFFIFFLLIFFKKNSSHIVITNASDGWNTQSHQHDLFKNIIIFDSNIDIYIGEDE